MFSWNIEDIEKILPKIRPLRTFIHFHMFPDLIHKPIWTTLKELDKTYAWSSLLPPDYWENFAKLGWLDPKDIPVHNWEVEDSLKEKTFRPIHQVINEKLEVSLNELTEPILIRFLAAYFDQGIADKPIPIHPQGLWKTFVELLDSSWIPLKPLTKKDTEWAKTQSPQAVINQVLSFLIATREYDQLYLQECALSLRGWAGFVKMIAHHPEMLPNTRPCCVLDFLAIRLLLEWAWIKNYFPSFKAVTQEELLPRIHRIGDAERNVRFDQFVQAQLAMETKHLQYFLSGLKKVISCHPKEARSSKAQFQLIFCIDDRECVLRRHIEAIGKDQVETYGTPGFFNLDFYLQRHPEQLPIKHCPDPLHTQRVVHVYSEFQNSPQLHHHPVVERSWEWLRLFWDLIVGYRKSGPLVEFILPEKYDWQKSFSLVEQVEKVASLLKSIGLVHNFSPYIFVVAHGATTQNNPYYNAYGCGACLGAAGYPNAIIFCEMANSPEVRLLLAQNYGIHIPDETQFVPALHDTTLDLIRIFAPEKAFKHLPLLPILEEGLRRTVTERVQDFSRGKKLKTFAEQRKFLWHKGYAWLEVRPEYLHTNATFCFVGRRSIIRDFSFERTAFLQSYDPLSDPHGDLLAGILKAAVPVCGGINMDYFFSRHNLLLGAGTKVSHNLVGLVGLSNGVEEDLLPGLAFQMVERHKPCRLSFIIEQRPELISQVLSARDELLVWFKNEWLLLFALWEGEFYHYQAQEGSWKIWEPSLKA